MTEGVYTVKMGQRSSITTFGNFIISPDYPYHTVTSKRRPMK